ncbi:MAG: cyclase family protein [Acidobacteriota bacterium]|nr:MAG: cyclase family protein [Acidobacteriota bacterium]
MKIHDITVPISNELPVYPGDPPIEIRRTQSIENGDIARVSHLSFGTHIGTHIDPPYHFIKEGVTLDQLPLDVLIGPARVVDCGEVAVIDRPLLSRLDLGNADRILFKTRNSRFWRESREFRKDFVYLETSAAEALVELGVRLVGIDYLSVEKYDFDQPTTHWTLLGNNVIVVEGLDLSEVTAGEYELICLPLRIRDGDGGPARVVLRELYG